MMESQNEILIKILNEVKTNRKEFGVAHAAHSELTRLVADDVSILKADRIVFEAKLNRLLESGKMTAKSLRLLVHRSKNARPARWWRRGSTSCFFMLL